MTKYDKIIKSASKEYRINPVLIKAIIRTESNWRPDVTRYEPHIKDTSYGLMQILTKTAQWITGNKNITGAQLKSPQMNILVGTRYLRYLMDKHNNTDKVIASYNAGKPYYQKRNPSKFTNQSYVDKVRKSMVLYNKGSIAIVLLSAASVGGYFLLRNQN